MAVCWDTALQAEMLQHWFPMVWLEFFIDIILPAALWPWVLTQPLTEMSTMNISWEVKWPVCWTDKLTTFTCRVSWNLGASTSRNTQASPGHTGIALPLDKPESLLNQSTYGKVTQEIILLKGSIYIENGYSMCNRFWSCVWRWGTFSVSHMKYAS